MLDAIILAAGESRRMGRLKPLIQLQGRTVLAHIEGALRQTEVRDIVVVVGYQAETIKQQAGISATFVENPEYSNGQFSSLQCGVQELAQDSDAVLVCLGDQPHIRPQWITPLIQAFYDTRPKIIRPSFHGKGGHPVIYSADVYEDILALPPTATAKTLMRRYQDSTHFVSIDTEGILFDADTPEDLQRIQSKFL